ncbi:hypothetical protein ABMA27_007250 [Loxostege sticticalis]|uniref:Uncharacterized protein n=1 Tax=Loxostege sticticalis TaxID=481309 RepID=A0ABR3HER8_LOXSC
MSFKPFISKNIVALVMVPVIIGGHYGWYKLQEIETLVTPEERAKLPIAKFFKNNILSSSSKD